LSFVVEVKINENPTFSSTKSLLSSRHFKRFSRQLVVAKIYQSAKGEKTLTEAVCL